MVAPKAASVASPLAATHSVAPIPPEKPAPSAANSAAPKHTNTAAPAAAKPGGGPAHVYLFRGLLNIFSLGMDDLAQKIQAAGVGATVYNHSEWREISDEIAARYKAGGHGPIILIGHSLGADAVMLMGEYLGSKGVPVALIVPFDGTRSFAASGNVAAVMNITQRDYAYMHRGYGFRGELANVDVSKDESIGHISIDKSPRLHAMVVNRVVAVAKRGGGPVQVATPTNVPSIPPSSHPASTPPNLSAIKPDVAPAHAAKPEPGPQAVQAPVGSPKADSAPSGPATGAHPAAAPAASPRASAAVPLEYQQLSR